MKKIIFLAVLLVMGTVAGRAQVVTWLQPTTVATNMSVDLAPNQVMQVLSLVLDPASSIDIVAGGAKVTLGSGGNPNLFFPLVLAGPATVVFKKSSTGGQGSLMTFRIVDASKGEVVLPVLPIAQR